MRRILPILVLTVLLPPAPAAQEAAITYQGQLRENGEPFTGTANLQFQLNGRNSLLQTLIQAQSESRSQACL